MTHGSPHAFRIGERKIGDGFPVYVIAEMSANHGHDIEVALKLIDAAKAAGADAIKLQTYTPDTLTIDSDKEWFRIKEGLWSGRTLYELYSDAFTPWEWQPRLQRAARAAGLDFFSTPFDETAVDFLELLDVPVHKVASFELVDIPLLEKIAATGKPVIMSTGMATLEEIDEAVRTLRSGGTTDLALLKCTSAYPAPADEANLRSIPILAKRFRTVGGLSDHTLGISVPVAAVAVGARIVEKHLTLSRAMGGPDAEFSLEPAEFRAMVDSVRTAESALGQAEFGPSEKEQQSRIFRRSLFVVKDVKAGEPFTRENVRAIRPGYGLHTRHLEEILGRRARRDVERGTPFEWSFA